jgi:cell division initiation protein
MMVTSGNDDSPVLKRRLTPTGLGQITFARSVRGYNPAQVDDMLREIRRSYEELWDEHEAFEYRSRDLAERLTRIEHDREAIGDVLIQARRTAAELEASARQDADRCVEEARTRAEAIEREAQAAADQLARENDERMERVAEETRLRVEADTRDAREDVARLRAEVERLEGLEREMLAGYRAFLLAALELLERDATPTALGDDSGARQSDGQAAAPLAVGEHEQPAADSEPEQPPAESEPEQPPVETEPEQPPVETEPEQPPAATRVA